MTKTAGHQAGHQYFRVKPEDAPPDALFDREVIRSSTGYGQQSIAEFGAPVWDEEKQRHLPLFRRTVSHDGEKRYFKLLGGEQST